jgi:fumarate reductase subunit D
VIGHNFRCVFCRIARSLEFPLTIKWWVLFQAGNISLALLVLVMSLRFLIPLGMLWGILLMRYSGMLMGCGKFPY